MRSTVGTTTLALGIGVSTVSFSAVRAVLLEPLPVTAEDELAVLWQRSVARNFDHVPFLPAALDAAQELGDPIEAVAAVPINGAVVTPGRGADGSFSIAHARIGGDFFGLLGVDPALGRMLNAEDDAVGAAPTVVLSHGYWSQNLGGREDVLGTVLEFARVPFTVVGVAPPEFDYPRGTEAWVTLRGSFPDWETDPATRYELDLIVRLRPGFGVDDAAAAMDRLFAEQTGLSARAADLATVGLPFTDAVMGDLRPMLLTTFVAGLVLLLVAIANATLLFLAGGARSLRESAMRRALGASSGRVVQPLASDAALQAALGVLGGVLLARLALAVLVPLAPPDFVRFDTIRLDVGSVLFGGVLGLLALGASAGIAGVWLARRDPATLLRGGAGATASGATFRRAIASAQVALAVVAAVGASLLWQTLRNLEALDRGFEPEGLYVVSVSLPFGFFEVPEGYQRVLEDVADGLGSRPGIRGASPSFSAPLLERGGIDFAPRLDGQTVEEARRNPYVGFDAVIPRYFAVAGTELRQGRGIDAGDGPDDLPVVVVNEAAARALWPGESPLGRQIHMGGLSRDESRTVVGVVEDHRFRTFPQAHPSVYVPLAQYDRLAPNRFLVRAEAGVELRTLVEAEFEARVGGVDVVTIESMTEVMRRPLRRPRFAASSLLAMALVTVLLAALGVHGVLSVIVAERRRDLGVRMALGARAVDVASHVARHLLWIGGIGGVLGALISLWTTDLLGALLYGLEPGVPGMIGVVVTASLALALVSGVVPTMRATKTDPAQTLRSE
jgi:predicted permease